MFDTENKILRNTLKKMPLFSNLMDEQLRFVQQGKELWLEPGDRLVTEGDSWKNFCVLLKGKLEWTKKIGTQEIHLLNLKPGVFFGHELFFLDMPYPATVRAVSNCHLFLQEEETFWRMLANCSSIAQKLLIVTVQRLRNLEAVTQQHAKLNSLSTIAAGLAHELNNPTAAACRAVEQLRGVINTSQSLFLKLHEQQPTVVKSEVFAEIRHQVKECAKASNRSALFLDSLTKSDREEELINWLDDRGIIYGWKLAPALVSVGLDSVWLNALAARLPEEALSDVLLWFEATLSAEKLLNETEESVWRIFHLVEAVKDYSYMDRAPQQEVDVHEGIENTLIILAQKLKNKGIVVTRKYANNLPRIVAYGSELNQVWTNLIDNAIDAVSEKTKQIGKIWICTSLKGKYLLVEVADNGTDISPEVKERIFEPFFTTKNVGQGSGLGLSIVYSIVVGRHKGDIRVHSKPGRTRFQICLPITQP